MLAKALRDGKMGWGMLSPSPKYKSMELKEELIMYDKFISLLQAKVGLNDDLTKKLLKHFSPDFIVNMAFKVYEKRLERQKKVSEFEMIMGPTSSEELVFEIFKKKVELDIAYGEISEDEAEMIFDGDYA